MNVPPQDPHMQVFCFWLSALLGCAYHQSFLHFVEQNLCEVAAPLGSSFPHCSHRRSSALLCRDTNIFTLPSDIPICSAMILYVIPSVLISRMVVFCVLVIIEKRLLSPGSRERRQKGTLSIYLLLFFQKLIRRHQTK